MTNTKFRKRMLLSSVAMLLVALVALGSATFAWFNIRPDAKATGLSAATTKASSLQIKELYSDDWASEITFDSNNYSPGNLNPVTFSGSAWKYAPADAYDMGYATDSTKLETITEPGTSSTYAAWSTVYVKYGETTSPASAEKDLLLTITAPSGTSTANALKFIRVAVKPVALATSANDDSVALGSTVQIVAPAANSDFSADPTKWVKPAAGEDAPTPAAGDSASNSVFGTAINLGNMTNGTIYGFKIFAYYEGTDPDCIDSNAGQTLNDFQFTFNTQAHSAG